VRFGGRIQHEGKNSRWLETEEIIAVAYDQIIPGYETDATNTLRLWSAQASSEINLGKFNQGLLRGGEDKNHSENVSRVLYPDDSTYSGRELRLRQNISSFRRRCRIFFFAITSCIKPMTTWQIKLLSTSTTPIRCCRSRS
jgi:hypothetical protein